MDENERKEEKHLTEKDGRGRRNQKERGEWRKKKGQRRREEKRSERAVGTNTKIRKRNEGLQRD